MLSDHHQSKKETGQRQVDSGVSEQRNSTIEEQPNIIENEDEFENYLYDAEQEDFGGNRHDAKKKKKSTGKVSFDEVSELKKNTSFKPLETADDVLDNLRNSFMTPGDSSVRTSYIEPPSNTSDNLKQPPLTDT